MQEIRLSYALISEDLDELNQLKAEGWTMRFNNSGTEIIARKFQPAGRS